MSKRSMKSAAVRVRGAEYSVPGEDQLDFQNRYIRLAARRAVQNTRSSTVTLEPQYFLDMAPAVSWLPLVERRIENSIIPNEYEIAATTEWLREDVGNAAIRFFQNTADVLPSEPFIYASQGGALVAEFQAGQGSLTAVISPNNIILFATKASDPSAPAVQINLQRGSNRLREDLREIVKTITGSHGQVGTSR